MSYGACGRCKQLGPVRRLGTLDPTTMQSQVLTLCETCAKLYLPLNRKQRRTHDKELTHVVRHGPRTGPRGRRQLPPRTKKKSPIITPDEAPSQLIVPGRSA